MNISNIECSDALDIGAMNASLIKRFIVLETTLAEDTTTATTAGETLRSTFSNSCSNRSSKLSRITELRKLLVIDSRIKNLEKSLVLDLVDLLFQLIGSLQTIESNPEHDELVFLLQVYILCGSLSGALIHTGFCQTNKKKIFDQFCKSIGTARSPIVILLESFAWWKSLQSVDSNNTSVDSITDHSSRKTTLTALFDQHEISQLHLALQKIESFVLFIVFDEKHVHELCSMLQIARPVSWEATRLVLEKTDGRHKARPHKRPNQELGGQESLAEDAVAEHLHVGSKKRKLQNGAQLNAIAAKKHFCYDLYEALAKVPAECDTNKLVIKHNHSSSSSTDVILKLFELVCIRQMFGNDNPAAIQVGNFTSSLGFIAEKDDIIAGASMANKRKFLVRILQFSFTLLYISWSRLRESLELLNQNASAFCMYTTAHQLATINSILTFVGTEIGGTLPNHEDFGEFKRGLMDLTGAALDGLSGIYQSPEAEVGHDLTTANKLSVAHELMTVLMHSYEVFHEMLTSEGATSKLLKIILSSTNLSKSDNCVDEVPEGHVALFQRIISQQSDLRILDKLVEDICQCSASLSATSSSDRASAKSISFLNSLIGNVDVQASFYLSFQQVALQSFDRLWEAVLVIAHGGDHSSLVGVYNLISILAVSHERVISFAMGNVNDLNGHFLRWNRIVLKLSEEIKRSLHTISPPESLFRAMSFLFNLATMAISRGIGHVHVGQVGKLETLLRELLDVGRSVITASIAAQQFSLGLVAMDIYRFQMNICQLQRDYLSTLIVDNSKELQMVTINSISNLCRISKAHGISGAPLLGYYLKTFFCRLPIWCDVDMDGRPSSVAELEGLFDVIVSLPQEIRQSEIGDLFRDPLLLECCWFQSAVVAWTSKQTEIALTAENNSLRHVSSISIIVNTFPVDFFFDKIQLCRQLFILFIRTISQLRSLLPDEEASALLMLSPLARVLQQSSCQSRLPKAIGSTAPRHVFDEDLLVEHCDVLRFFCDHLPGILSLQTSSLTPETASRDLQSLLCILMDSLTRKKLSSPQSAPASGVSSSHPAPILTVSILAAFNASYEEMKQPSRGRPNFCTSLLFRTFVTSLLTHVPSATLLSSSDDLRPAIQTFTINRLEEGGDVQLCGDVVRLLQHLHLVDKAFLSQMFRTVFREPVNIYPLRDFLYFACVFVAAALKLEMQFQFEMASFLLKFVTNEMISEGLTEDDADRSVLKYAECFMWDLLQCVKPHTVNRLICQLTIAVEEHEAVLSRRLDSRSLAHSLALGVFSLTTMNTAGGQATDCLRLLAALMNLPNASSVGDDADMVLIQLEWIARLLSSEVCSSSSASRGGTKTTSSHPKKAISEQDFVVPLIIICLGSVSTSTLKSVSMVTSTSTATSAGTGPDITKRNEGGQTVKTVSGSVMSQVCDCLCLVIDALTHRGNLLYSSMPVIGNLIRQVLSAIQKGAATDSSILINKIPRLFAGLTKNSQFFRKQAHVWCSTLLDVVAKTSGNLQAQEVEGVKYGLFAILDQMNTKQKKQVYALLDPSARTFLNELQRIYNSDYKFAGKT